jgi:outer membrane protein assembly factor BamB
VLASLFLFPASSVAQQDTVVPQTALSPCSTASVVSREPLVAGTGISASPDGRWLALYVHTNRGGEVTLRPREGGELRRIELTPPALLPGVTWRVLDAAFSPGSNLLAVRSLGAISMVDVAAGKTLYQIEFDSERQLYPGRLSLTDDTLAVIFWPAESYLADVQTKKGVELRFYEAATGKLLRTLTLAVESSEAWVDLELAPDASRVAILRRARRWPGKAELSIFTADDGKLIWETKVSAEDFQWSGDGKSLFSLGGRFITLDAATGKQKSESKDEYGPSEFQKLRVNETAGLAVGQFSRYSRFKRSLHMSDRGETLLVVWRLNGAAPVCQTPLPPTQSVEPWLTTDGEIIALEELYELRPPLRLLKSAQLVTYRLAPK